jgi:WhiB family redox-sensing transcriptional regulator
VSWVTEAACRDAETELFFSSGKRRTDEALSYCQGCTVRAECLDDALRAEEGMGASYRFGIYAGMTPQERYGERRRRQWHSPAAERRGEQQQDEQVA